MPATDALQPPGLPKAAKDIIKSYGGWTQFMTAFGLKPWNLDDVEEAQQILAGFVKDDEGGGGKKKD